MPFPIILDIEGKLSDKYGIRGTPAHLLIDRKGDIQGFAQGYRNMKSKKVKNLIQYMIDL